METPLCPLCQGPVPYDPAPNPTQLFDCPSCGVSLIHVEGEWRRSGAAAAPNHAAPAYADIGVRRRPPRDNGAAASPP
jgi:hypothetical protein